MSESTGELSFDCPRCAKTVSARYYGPCPACATELQAKYSAETRHVEAPEYVPKMNVTPNAVATKD